MTETKATTARGSRVVAVLAAAVLAASALAAAVTTSAVSASRAYGSTTVVDRAVTTSADDAEEAAGGAVQLASTDLELTNDGTDQIVAMRFTALPIPKSATITAAWVQFEVDEPTSGATNLELYAQASDTAPAITSTARGISSRPRTTASVAWSPAPWPTIQVAGPDQRTPNLAAIVQEVVDRPGWTSGNALAVIVTGTGRRTAESYDGTRAPALHVEYTTEAAVNSAPIVSAGPDRLVTRPAAATLAGTVGDDGLPAGATVTATWTQVSGAGTAAFADAHVPSTTATFGAPGRYVLRLSASDTELTRSDDVIVDVFDPATTVGQVHYSWMGADAVTLDWRGGAGDLRYGPTPNYGTAVQAQPPAITPASSGGPYWEAALSGLAPATTYHYAISGGADATFSTPPSGPFRFDALGDIGSSLKHPAVATVHNELAADAPAMVIGLGDLSYANNDGLAGVDRFFDDIAPWSRRAAFMPAWGNHEWAAPDDLRNTKGRVAIPNARASTGAPALGCCGEDWGWFDAGGVRFISYPEPYVTATRTAWETAVRPIMADAQANPAIHFIVTIGHRPAYSTGTHPGEAQLAGIVNRLGDTYTKYVLNLNGHSHLYERFLPIHHVVNVTAGAGGRALEGPLAALDPRTAFRALHLSHLRVDVSDSQLHVEAVCGPTNPDENLSCAEGSVLDAVTITAPTTTNRAPEVDAGPDRSGRLSDAIALTGTATDDGNPSGGSLATTWSQVAGPGTATFADATAPATTVEFDAPGTYVLRIAGSDGALTSTDDLTATVTDPGPVVVERPVAKGSDDAEEAVTTGTVSLWSSDLQLTTDGTTVQQVGLRITTLAVPVGATITRAYLQFQTRRVSTGAASLTVAGQSADNPGTFTTAAGNVSGRTRTVASVPWSPLPWATVGDRGPDQRTPDLSPVLQEVVRRPGWKPGNAMVFVITGSGRRTAESFNGTWAPTLHVEFEVG